MYIHVGDANEQLTARVPNSAVHADLLKQVHGWLESGVTNDNVVDRLRLKTVPADSTFHIWVEGTIYLLK